MMRCCSLASLHFKFCGGLSHWLVADALIEDTVTTKGQFYSECDDNLPHGGNNFGERRHTVSFSRLNTNVIQITISHGDSALAAKKYHHHHLH